MKKDRKKFNTAGKQQISSNRGRPSKVDQDQILHQRYQWIGSEFGRRNMRQPIDPQFKPYYERFLQGDLQAIAEYCDRNVRQLGDSFYELIGRLFFLQFYRGVKPAISDIARRVSTGWITKRATYEHWYERLLPLCQKARKFIKESYATCPDTRRERLWHDYVFQPLPIVRYGHLGGQKDEERLQREANERDQLRRRAAIEELLAWADGHTEASGRSRLSGLGCANKELHALAQGNFHLESVNRFSPYGFVPHEIFFELALTRKERAKRPFVYKPADAACRYACKIVRVSESWARHKNERK